MHVPKAEGSPSVYMEPCGTPPTPVRLLFDVVCMHTRPRFKNWLPQETAVFGVLRLLRAFRRVPWVRRAQNHAEKLISPQRMGEADLDGACPVERHARSRSSCREKGNISITSDDDARCQKKSRSAAAKTKSKKPTFKSVRHWQRAVSRSKTNRPPLRS